MIHMEYISGEKLSDNLESLDYKSISKLIAENISKMHNQGIIHGDLTTSNMILSKGKLYFIDFGLSHIDEKLEHKAVDLHLLKQALESKHYKNFDSSFKAVLDSYKTPSLYVKDDKNTNADRT